MFVDASAEPGRSSAKLLSSMAGMLRSHFKLHSIFDVDLAT